MIYLNESRLKQLCKCLIFSSRYSNDLVVINIKIVIDSVALSFTKKLKSLYLFLSAILWFFLMSKIHNKELPTYVEHPNADGKEEIYYEHAFGLRRLVCLLLSIGILCSVILCATGGEEGDFNGLPFYQIDSSKWNVFSQGNYDGLCPVAEKIDPIKYLANKDGLNIFFNDEKYRNSSLNKLAGAIEIPTEVYDDMVNPPSIETEEELFEFDNRWRPWAEFHQYLNKTFPKVHENLKVEKINKLGLIYTWKGSTTKKPIMLTAHIDVVPVENATLDEWTYPPFHGTVRGKYMYGRGVSDCKSLLIALMETLELLLAESSFHPERTIILAFGYDEESKGSGAAEISKYLLREYGSDSFYAIIDEGNSGYYSTNGLNLVLPATGEKGYVDSSIKIFTPGGHSSIPPKHTLIGLLAKIIETIEDEEFDSIITPANPVMNYLQCIAEHSTSIDKSLRRDIMRAHFDIKSNENIRKYLGKDLLTKYLIQTSQAVDTVFGGVKSNALPEFAEVLVNHRIAIELSVEDVSSKILSNIHKVADKYDLGIYFDGKSLKNPTANGHISYSLVDRLEPAPSSPVDDNIWNTFGGSLRYLYEELINPHSNKTFIISPFISTGNTDTKSYWDLSRNIYRYVPGLSIETSSNVHSIDEKLQFEEHFIVQAFYYYYLQVVDKVSDDVGK